MQISLHSPLRKFLFVAGCAAVAGSYLFLASVSYRAHRLAVKGDFEAAIHLEPLNADYYRQMGQLSLFTDTNPKHSTDILTNAVALNSFSARTWLALASAYQVSGNPAKQKESLLRAIEADPTTPEVAWEAAVFSAASGQIDPALRYFRVVAQYDDPSLPLDACWKLTHDPDRILLSAMPDTVPAHAAFLQLMVENNQILGAEKTWDHFMRMRKSFEPKLVFFYIQFLLDHYDGPGAKKAWRELAELNPVLSSYRSSTNLIVNPGFEEEMLNGGLDWQFKSAPGTALAIDTTTFHSGTRSLAIAYSGESNADAGVSQYLPVEPNTRYELTLYTKADQLMTANGPYAVITEARTHETLARTEEFTGSYSWKPMSINFNTGSDSTLVLINLRRSPETTRIRGKLWLDDFNLVQK